MISKITLKNFRLYDDFSINCNNRLVILSGKNAVGKTSILEAINIASTTKSHRSINLLDVIKSNKEYLQINLSNDDKNFKIILSKNEKNYFINGIKINKASDFIGNLKTVMFSPQDQELIDGSKQIRRRFLDLDISLNDKEYLIALSKYKKLLSERNNILKSDKLNQAYLNVITLELISNLKIINKKRKDFINLLNQKLEETSKELCIKKIELKYHETYDINDLEKSFSDKLKSDILTKSTNIGTHRDDLIIYYNDLLALNYASEGEKRIIAISIKLSLARLIEDIYKIKPIIMLDDVYASLDKDKIKALSNYVLRNGQTFITTTSILEIPDVILKDALVIRIEKEIK